MGLHSTNPPFKEAQLVIPAKQRAIEELIAYLSEQNPLTICGIGRHLLKFPSWWNMGKEFEKLKHAFTNINPISYSTDHAGSIKEMNLYLSGKFTDDGSYINFDNRILSAISTVESRIGIFAIGFFASKIEKQADRLLQDRVGDIRVAFQNVVSARESRQDRKILGVEIDAQRVNDEGARRLEEAARQQAEKARRNAEKVDRYEAEEVQLAKQSKAPQKLAREDRPQESSTSTGRFEGLRFPGAHGDTEYRLSARRGSGGFGSVFEASRSQSGQPDARVAIKIFLIEEADQNGNQVFDHGAITRKLNELVTQVAERHECIVSTPRHGIGSVDLRGQLGVFIEMELAAHDLLHTARRGRMPPNDVRSLVIDVCRGLAFLHDRPNPIVHRDIKPGNILWFPEQRRWKLGDLGLARELSQPGQLTRTAQIGTPVYMSPEAFRGEVGAGSDMWALGVMIAELLIGRVPFGHGVGEVYQVMYQILEGQPDFCGVSLPAPFDRIVAGCLNKDWRHRLTARQVLDMLSD